jgi:capsule polysaccharide export protein KpsE/RkpR
LSKIEVGHPKAPAMEQKQKTDESTFFIPIASMPDLGLKLVRLTREAKIQEKVFELMTTQFELAKMEEAKDVNIIQVLDRAILPEKRSFPKRRFIVLVSTFIALFISVILAFLGEYVTILHKENPVQYDSIKANFDVIGWFKRKMR